LNGGRTCPIPQTENCIIPIANISPPGITTGNITNSTDKFMIFTTGTTSFTVQPGGVICDILMIGGGGAGGYYGGGGGAGACIVAIGHKLPGGMCNVTVGPGGYYIGAGVGSNSTAIKGSSIYIGGGVGAGAGSDSSISVDGITLYLAKGGGRGASGGRGGRYIDGVPGGCGGGAGLGEYAGSNVYATRKGEDFVTTNIVNGELNISPTIEPQPTYAIFGNKGGDQEDLRALATAGGGGIGAAGGNHANGVYMAGSGGAGLNDATINGIPYNFKSYFANNNPFGHNNNGYIGGGGSGDSMANESPGGIGGGGKGNAAGYYTNTPGIIATPGAVNTGSGGGSGSFDEGDISGGSGIVIIRYRS
jgi:hypothetical protein